MSLIPSGKHYFATPEGDGGFYVFLQTWINDEAERRFQARLMVRATIYHGGAGWTEQEAIDALLQDCHTLHERRTVQQLVGREEEEA